MGLMLTIQVLVDLKATGVVDPARVTKEALMNAARLDVAAQQDYGRFGGRSAGEGAAWLHRWAVACLAAWE